MLKGWKLYSGQVRDPLPSVPGEREDMQECDFRQTPHVECPSCGHRIYILVKYLEPRCIKCGTMADSEDL